MTDQPDDPLLDPRRRAPAGPGEVDPRPDGRGACERDGRHYPEGTTMMVDGRPATCRNGRWVGQGDDPPFAPRRGTGRDDLDPQP